MSPPISSLTLDDLPDAVIITSLEGKILSWSRGAEALFGYSSDEAVGHIQTDLLAAAGHVDCAEPSNAENGALLTFETMRRRKDGSLVDVCVSLRPLRDPGGTINGIISTAKDMTNLKVIRDSKMLRSRFGELLESMPDGIVMINQSGRVVFANSQAERQFLYEPGELIGRLIEELIPTRFRHKHVGHRTNYFTQPRTRPMGAGLELFGLRKDGTEFPVEISLSPLKTGDGNLVSSAIRDISDRKLFQKELQAKNKALEVANEELEAFSYSISHDLRAPLRAMGGFARILEKQFDGSAPEEAKQAMGRIRENAAKMGKLIDGLLDFSSLGRRELSKRLVSPTPLARAVFDEMRADAGDRQIEISISEMPACEADPTLLRQVYTNLISNAAKYTRDRACAKIEIGWLQQNAEDVYFVRDNGAGFEMEYAQKLFRVFQRLHRSDQFEGTGVGLAIVHRIIERHGGRIWAEGKTEEGATFFFTLKKAPHG